MTRKIDIYLFNLTRNCWQYECSTMRSKTCKEAKARFLAVHSGLHPSQVKTAFAK